jgi:hypothetical protein
MGWIGNAPSQGLVTGGGVVDGSIDTVDLKDSAVTTAKLNNEAVTAAKLSSTAIADKLGYTPQSAAQVAAAIAALVNSAPSALDTLKELSDALGADANFATTMTNALAGKQASLGYTPVNKAGDTMSGDLTVPRLHLSNANSNGDIHFLDADSGDLYLDVVPGTRRVRLRNWNKSSPNMTVTELQLGKIHLVADSWTPALTVGTTGKTFALYREWANATNTVSIGNTTDGVEGVRIDHVGRVMMPNQPSFYAYTFTTGSYSDGALIPFSQTQFNRNNCFNTSNSRFTAPVNGIYAFHIGMYVYNGSSGIQQSFVLRVNNAQLALSGDHTVFYSGPSGVSQDNMTTGTILVALAAGDYVTLNMRGGASAVNCYSGHSYFAGNLIG